MDREVLYLRRFIWSTWKEMFREQPQYPYSMKDLYYVLGGDLGAVAYFVSLEFHPDTREAHFIFENDESDYRIYSGESDVRFWFRFLREAVLSVLFDVTSSDEDVMRWSRSYDSLTSMAKQVLPDHKPNQRVAPLVAKIAFLFWSNLWAAYGIEKTIKESQEGLPGKYLYIASDKLEENIERRSGLKELMWWFFVLEMRLTHVNWFQLLHADELHVYNNSGFLYDKLVLEYREESQVGREQLSRDDALQNLRAANEAVVQAQAALVDAVALARNSSVTWREVAEALGVTHQAAHSRFAGKLALSAAEDDTQHGSEGLAEEMGSDETK